MDSDSLKKEVKKIRWWHTMDLGNGVITPGMVDPQENLDKYGIPTDLSGKTVLDIGAWDGFFSYEAERRGAKKVLATDSYCWGGGGWGNKDGFLLARRALNSNVSDKNIDVLNLSPKKVGEFDLVLFLGVLYHMRHPLLALEKVASVTKKHLILETHTDMFFFSRPLMRFYPGKELANDPTNWFGPNPSCIEAMLKTIGFKKIKLYSTYLSPVQMLRNALRLKIKENKPFFETVQQNRVVYHAWK